MRKPWAQKILETFPCLSRPKAQKLLLGYSERKFKTRSWEGKAGTPGSKVHAVDHPPHGLTLHTKRVKVTVKQLTGPCGNTPWRECSGPCNCTTASTVQLRTQRKCRNNGVWVWRKPKVVVRPNLLPLPAPSCFLSFAPEALFLDFMQTYMLFHIFCSSFCFVPCVL